MTRSIIELAYNLDGNSLPYNSKDANVRIKIRRTSKRASIETEHHRLPSLWFQDYGGSQSINYLPKNLADRIYEDAENLEKKTGMPIILGLIASLPFSEEIAKSHVKMLEWVYRELPPASSGDCLSTRMNW